MLGTQWAVMSHRVEETHELWKSNMRAGTSVDPLHATLKCVSSTDIVVTATPYRVIITELKGLCPFQPLITCQVLD